MEKRIKNIYFVLGLVGVVFAAGGINFDSLTSWKLFMNGILSILNNPVAVVAVILAVLGVFVNPTTPGLTDKENK